ncbi:expressed protein [Phakopsora pachyrhizi]|uniref:Expressed protein n=1 Tax=Phakopsora pachyrhizi TaxID=170000 RepID=A0AAV0B9B5_PHAPC|nr:expressed protein [Phakopsora pachyrhizi]
MTQMIGRGLRRSDLTGKKDCQVIDIFGSVLGGMIVKPTLDGLDLNQLSSDDFNSDRNHSFEKPTREGEGFTESLSYREPISIKSLTFTHFESPFLDEPEFVLARDLHKLTRHSWVGCGAGIYVLDLLGHGHLRIQPERKSSESIEFIIYLSWSINVDKNSKKRLVKPFEIGKAQKLEEAIRTADSFLRIAVRQNRYNLTFGLLQSLSRSASWRKGRISDQQRSILKAKIFKDNEEDDDDGEKRLMNLNKGQAANLLTRLYHGFKRRLEKRVKDDETMKRKIEKLKLNEEFGRSRIIKVGKLKT